MSVLSILLLESRFERSCSRSEDGLGLWPHRGSSRFQEGVNIPAMRLFVYAFLTVSTITSTKPAAGQEVEARTRYGVVSGTESRGLRVFKGIPYAAPPTGDLRWKKPVSPPPWNGTRAATEFSG